MPRLALCCGDRDTLASALAGAAGGVAGACAMSRVPALRRADDRTTALISQAVAGRMLDVPLTDERLNRLTPVVRYGYGTMAGVAYALFTNARWNAVIAGAAWGAVLWVTSDLVVVPALASFPPREATRHTARSLLSHLVYGVTAAVVARGVRTAITRSTSTQVRSWQ